MKKHNTSPTKVIIKTTIDGTMKRTNIKTIVIAIARSKVNLLDDFALSTKLARLIA